MEGQSGEGRGEANAVMTRRLPALCEGTRVSFAGNCRKQKPQID